jgi:phosphocarrier protein
MNTIKKEVMIDNKLGLHLRAAASFVKLSNKFKSDIDLYANGNTANAKSIMSLMALAASYGTKLVITANGSDAKLAIEELSKLVIDKFGEKE